MRRLLLATGVAASFFVSGCAIHPMPEDVTGLKTADIVRQIRCEARETLRNDIIVWLRRLAVADPRYGVFEQLATQYETYPESISTFSYTLFNGPELVEVRKVVKTFYSSAVAYNFELTMTEDNNVTTEVDFLRQIVNPKFTLALTGGSARKRVNDRTFTVTDTFSGLLKLPQQFCSGRVVGPNYIYPIAGHIGLDKVIDDFIDLTLFGNLSGASSGGSGSGSGGSGSGSDSSAPAGAAPKAAATQTAKASSSGAPPTLSDKLTFTTSFTGGANPVATFTPIGRNFLVSAASLSALGDRIDVHQVTVAVAISPSEMTDLASLRSYLFSPARVATAYGQPYQTITGPSRPTSLIVGNRVIGSGTPAEQLALIAVDQFKSREIELVPTP